MAFGWSFPKLMVVLSLGFLVLGVPLMALGAVYIQRWKDRSIDE